MEETSAFSPLGDRSRKSRTAKGWWCWGWGKKKVVVAVVFYVLCLAKTREVSITFSAHYAVDTYDTNTILNTLSKSVSVAAVTNTTNTTNDDTNNILDTLSSSVLSIAAVTNTTNDDEDEQNRHFLTQNSTSLPAWFKEYSISHREQRAALNETNWKNQRFLIMRCLDFDEKCGGASDRLQGIPSMLMLANQTGRLFFIKWSRPAPLQEFLLPPTGGLDWTIPHWLDSKLDFRKLPTGRNMKKAESSEHILTFRLQNTGIQKGIYNLHKSANELEYDRVLRDIWDTLFTPSPPVAALIRQNMKDLNLVPGAYVAAHVRALYLSDASNNTRLIRNGINCATKLKPGLPVYFASDSSKATRAALEYGRSKQKANVTATATVVARIADTEPLHIDRGMNFLHNSNEWQNVSAAAFYDTFVDLYLLAGSQCLSYGVGGYGLWGSLLSHNSSCRNSHKKVQCGWTDL
jgi:hypothetical protein